MTGKQGVDVEFGRRIKPAVCHRNLLPQQAVGADDLIFRVAFQRPVEHQQMIANGVIGVDVALAAHGVGRQLRIHLFDEDAISHGLRRVDFPRSACKAGFKISDAPKHIAGNRFNRCL